MSSKASTISSTSDYIHTHHTTDTNTANGKYLEITRNCLQKIKESNGETISLELQGMDRRFVAYLAYKEISPQASSTDRKVSSESGISLNKTTIVFTNCKNSLPTNALPFFQARPEDPKGEFINPADVWPMAVVLKDIESYAQKKEEEEWQGKYETEIKYIYNLILAAIEAGVDCFSLDMRDLDLKALQKVINEDKVLSQGAVVTTSQYNGSATEHDVLLHITMPSAEKWEVSKVDTKLALNAFFKELTVKRHYGLQKRVIDEFQDKQTLESFIGKYKHLFKTEKSKALLESLWSFAYYSSQALTVPCSILNTLKTLLLQDPLRATDKDRKDVDTILKALSFLTSHQTHSDQFLDFFTKMGKPMKELIFKIFGFEEIRKCVKEHSSEKEVSKQVFLPILLPHKGMFSWKIDCTSLIKGLSQFHSNIPEVTLRMLTGGFHYEEIVINNRSFECQTEKNQKDRLNQEKFFTEFLKRLVEEKVISLTDKEIHSNVLSFIDYKPKKIISKLEFLTQFLEYRVAVNLKLELSSRNISSLIEEFMKVKPIPVDEKPGECLSQFLQMLVEKNIITSSHLKEKSISNLVNEFISSQSVSPILVDEAKLKKEERKALEDRISSENENKLKSMLLAQLWNNSTVGKWSLVQNILDESLPGLFKGKKIVATNDKAVNSSFYFTFKEGDSSTFSFEVRRAYIIQEQLYESGKEEKFVNGRKIESHQYGKFTISFINNVEKGEIKESQLLIESFEWLAHEQKSDRKKKILSKAEVSSLLFNNAQLNRIEVSKAK